MEKKMEHEMESIGLYKGGYMSQLGCTFEGAMA